MPENIPPAGPADTIVPELETANRPRRPWLRQILTGVAVGALAIYALGDEITQKVADLTVPSYVSARRDQRNKDEVVLAGQKKAVSDLDTLYEDEKNGTVTTGVGASRLLPSSTIFEGETIALENSIQDILASREAEADSIDADPTAAAEAQRGHALATAIILKQKRLGAVDEWERLMTESTDSVYSGGSDPLQRALKKAGLTTADEPWMKPLREFTTEWSANVDGASDANNPASEIEQAADLSVDIAGTESPKTLEDKIAEVTAKLAAAKSRLSTLRRKRDFAIASASAMIESLYETEVSAVPSVGQFVSQNTGRASALRASLPGLEDHLNGLLDGEYQKQRKVLESSTKPALAKNAQDAWIAMGFRGIFARKLMIPKGWDLSFVPRAQEEAAAYMACGLPSEKEPIIVVTCADGSPEITSVYRCGTDGYEKLTGEDATDAINGQFPSSKRELCDVVDSDRWQVVKMAEVEEAAPAATAETTPAASTTAPAAPAEPSSEAPAAGPTGVTPLVPVEEAPPAPEAAPVAPDVLPTAPAGWYKLSDSAVSGGQITDPGLNQLSGLASQPAFEHALVLVCKEGAVDGGVVTFSLPNTVPTNLWAKDQKGCEIDGFQPLRTCIQSVCGSSTLDGTYGTVLIAK